MAIDAQTIPLEPPRTQTDVGRLSRNVGFLASRFTYVAAKLSNRTLADFDLSVRPYTILELSAVGEGLSQRELGRILCVDPSNVLRLVDQLVDRGLVARVRDTRDRRRTIISATAAGRDLAGAAGDALDAAYAPLLARFSQEDRDHIDRLLGQLALEPDTARD